MNKITIWFDITNTPQVHFLIGIKEILQNDFENFVFTAREFSETTKLLGEKVKDDFQIFGGHAGKNRIAKAISLIKRFSSVYSTKINYDLSISCGSESAIWSSKFRRKKSIAFIDNDLGKHWTYALFVDYVFCPVVIDEKILIRQGLNSKKLYKYDGYKEDIYIADYKPEKDFLDRIPFKNYVVLRPENLKANYVKSTSGSIIPELSKILVSKEIDIIYLPRYKDDIKYIKEDKHIYVPKDALNGIDLCYYSDAVLTGAGSFAREAACLGVPAFSFFAGKKLLAVDKKLVDEGKIFYSRDPDLIVKNFLSSKKHTPENKKSKTVKDEVDQKLKHIISNFFD